ncbi:hypothetical protein CHCC20333_1030 [Bacillus paralicheniformis]|nr:hypothetical protein CHCC20333_1030 [Bacillus paralicheniformis]
MLKKIKRIITYKHFFCFKCKSITSVKRGYWYNLATEEYNGPFCPKCGRSFKK